MPNVGRLVKESAVKELSERLSQRPDFLVTTMKRLPVAEADRLRQKLSGSQARLVMIKRTLGERMMEQLNLSGVTELFEGSIGLVLPGEDILPAAKIIVEFIKTHEEQLAVRGAFIEGVLLDKQRVEQLASLPPKPMLLAQVVATIESPIADVIFTIERLIGDIAWLVEQAGQSKPATEPGAPAVGVGGDGSAAAAATPEAAGVPPAGGDAAPEQKPTPPQEGTPA